MVGDRMVVAPLFAGEARRSVVLPPGVWRDFWTGKVMEGGRMFTVSGATEKIPVYVKDGSVMPWGAVAQHAGAKESRSLTVRVYGDGALPWAAPESAGGLRLTWDGGRGRVEQGGGGGASIEVTEWQRMG